MSRYKCLSCGYCGDELVCELTDYSYCVASNEMQPDYVSTSPDWVEKRHLGAAEIGPPVGCPKCHAWGEGNFAAV